MQSENVEKTMVGNGAGKVRKTLVLYRYKMKQCRLFSIAAIAVAFFASLSAEAAPPRRHSL